MTDYQQQTEANAAATAARVAAVVGAHRVGRIQLPEVPAWVGPIIRAGAARAVTLADVSLASQLRATTGLPVPAVGLTLPDEASQRITTKVREAAQQATEEPATDDPDRLGGTLHLLAVAAPLDAGQQAHQDAMTEQGIPGWTRQTDADPCALCSALADGKVIPINKQMVRHPGCSCVAVPVLTGAEPFEDPESGALDPADFVPRTLTTGHGIYGRQYTRVQPGLRITRDVFIPARVKTR